MRPFRSFVVVSLALGLIAGCGQNNSGNKANQTQGSGASQTGTGTNAMMGNRPRLRVVCANDISRLCQGDQRVRRCLRQNMQSLSADCHSALVEVLEAARERRMERMNSNNNSNNNGGNNNNGNNAASINNGYGGTAGNGTNNRLGNGSSGNTSTPGGDDGDGDQ